MSSYASGFMPQGGFGGGFGGQQGGGYQPSRQSFGQQRGFGGGFGGYGMPQQQQNFGGFGGGYGMPQQQQGGFGGFGGGFGGYGMPQQQMGGFGGFGGGYGMPQQQMGGFNQMPRQQQESGGYGIPQQQQGGYNQMNRTPSLNLDAIRQSGLGDEFGASQAAAQAATLQSMGMPQQSSMLGGINQMGGGSQSAAMQQGGSDAARLYEQFQASQRMGQGQPGPGGSQSASQSAAPQQATMPGNPYAQQMRQEDPRMQAMRYMQRMNFGGGGGYNF